MAALRRGDGRALPERGPALLLNIWLRRDAARDRCASACGQRRSRSGHLCKSPARNQDVGSRPPALAGRRGDLPTKRDASRRPPPRIVQICRQSKDLQSDAAPKRARGTPVDAAGGSTSPLPQTFDSCAAAGPAKAQTGCPPCASH